MNIDSCLNVNGVKESLDTAFNGIINHINNATTMTSVVPEIKKYFEEVETMVNGFFLHDNAGNVIKKLYICKPETQVQCKDFTFAVDQYEKYMDGMNSYIKDFDGKAGNGLPTEMVDSFNQVLDKDEDFIKMLFIDNGGSNPEVSCSVVEALNKSLTPLIKITEMTNKFKDMNLTDSPSSKLIALSSVRFCYYFFRGVMDSVVNILNNLQGMKTSNNLDPVGYAVF